MQISTKFAVDRNRDRKIAPEEIVAFKDLKSHDSDDNGKLEGKEFQDVYFQYGEDVWLEGGKRHRLTSENAIQTIELKSLTFDPARMDLSVNIQL